MKKMPDAYSGREQAFVKHTMLEFYLQRLFMIIGRSKSPVINYVDCFAGPWQTGDDKLADTSIGISLSQMAFCRDSLHSAFGRDVKFKALYVERDPDSFHKLQTFLNAHPYGNVETAALFGNYSDLTSEIIRWCGPHFTFFFIDPKGFKNIDVRGLQPLLQMRQSEFLINLMYDFINRFISLERHAPDWQELLGEVPDLDDLEPAERQDKIVRLYKANLNTRYRGRTAHVCVQKPGKDRPLYYLVYLTRNALGIDVFKHESEKMEIIQRVVQKDYKLSQKSERTQMHDMFADVSNEDVESRISDNKLSAKIYLLSKISGSPLEINHDVWASMLEETNFFPSDFQEAMKELVSEGKVENLDADIRRRRTEIIKRDYSGKSERWCMKTIK